MRREKGTREVGDIKAFLGEGTEFKGVLSFQGTVRIDGRVQGEVLGEELLIVGEDGVIQADVEVGSLIASGRIEMTLDRLFTDWSWLRARSPEISSPRA